MRVTLAVAVQFGALAAPGALRPLSAQSPSAVTPSASTPPASTPPAETTTAALEHAAHLHQRAADALRAGEARRALPLLDEAVALRRRHAPGSDALRRSLNNLGLASQSLGRFDDAHDAFTESLALARALGPESDAEAAVLNNLGTLAYERGDLLEAERRLRAALALRMRLAPESLAAARSLNNLAALLEERGELERAESWYRQSLELRRRLNAPPDEIATTLSNLAILLARRGAGDTAALFAREAAELATRAELGPVDVSWAEKVLAHVLLETLDAFEPSTRADRLDEAERAARRAVELARRAAADSTPTADTLDVLARAQRERGAFDAAAASLGEALDIRRRRAPGSRWEAASWRELARLEHRRGDLPTAWEHLERAIQCLEASDARPGEAPRERARAAAESVSWYRDAALWLAALGRLDDAFDYAERARARGLLATLAERRLRFDRDLPPPLEARRSELAAAFDDAWRRLEHASSVDTGTTTALRAELAALHDARQQLDDEIRARAPRLVALREPARATAAEVARALPANALLLLWIVGDDETLLLALGPHGAGLEAHALDLGAAELERLADSWAALLHGAARSVPAADPGTASSVPDDTIDAAERALGQRLWDELLAPIEHRLERAERLVVVSDRALLRLPFAALVDAEGRRLVEHLAVSHAPSATIAARARWSVDMQRPLVAFGDPASTADALGWSRREVETLGSLHPGASRVFLGAAAREAAFKRLDESIGWIHVAGHTEVHDLFPLESALRLAPGGSDNGQLQAWEIYEQLRIDADLVVLSACASAAGREVDGEGLNGLARAFLFAGARAVVASRWPVHDRPTALLMLRFHAHLRRGLALDEALRQAQLDLADGRASDSAVREPRRRLPWRSGHAATADLAAAPGHWAAFELILGADEPIAAPARSAAETP